jgi:mRNA interferase MazF
MERFVKGEVVVFKFPFSDVDKAKKRPALVSANTSDENLILCQITTQDRPDPDTILITQTDFQQGGLKWDSFIRPTILFSIHNSRIEYKVGKLKQEKIRQVEKKFCEIFTR